MKYSEFKQEVEKMGFVVEDDGTPIYVDKSKDGETLMSIGKHKQFWLDPGWSGFNNLTEDQKLKLYELGYELSKTPLAEREEEKKYQVRFPKVRRTGLPTLLTKMFCPVGDYVILDCPSEVYIEDHMEQFLFTEQEIKDIDERYLAFKVEVKDE